MKPQQFYFKLVNLSLNKLYCVILSLPVSLEYKATSMQNGIVNH